MKWQPFLKQQLQNSLVVKKTIFSNNSSTREIYLSLIFLQDQGMMTTTMELDAFLARYVVPFFVFLVICCYLWIKRSYDIEKMEVSFRIQLYVNQKCQTVKSLHFLHKKVYTVIVSYLIANQAKYQDFHCLFPSKAVQPYLNFFIPSQNTCIFFYIKNIERYHEVTNRQTNK